MVGRGQELVGEFGEQLEAGTGGKKGAPNR